MKNLKSFILTNTLGTFLEYLDATLYAFFATLIAHDFFPQGDAAAALLMSFAIFSVAFLVRPFGALLFGYFGDRYGRRNVLVVNILMMAVATMGIGMIPTYARVGLLAPLLLVVCRILQGLAVSSEFTGSSIYLLETTTKQHGLFSGICTAVASFGIFSASFLAMQLTRFHLEHYWQWVFVAGGFTIGVVGVYLRRHQGESPAFLHAKESNLLHRWPLMILFKQYRRSFLYAMALSMYIGVVIYATMVYSSTYLMGLGMSSQEALTISTLLALIEACSAVFSGWLSDYLGGRVILFTSVSLMLVLAWPLFAVISPLHFWRSLGALSVLVFLVGCFDGPFAYHLLSQFEVPVRQSGISLSYNLGGSMVGGLTPMFLTYALAKTHIAVLPSFLIIGVGLLAFFILWKKNPKESPHDFLC